METRRNRRSRSRSRDTRQRDTRRRRSYNEPRRPMPYTLKEYKVTQTKGLCGDFVVHKEFKVRLNNKIKGVYGYVIQKIEKHTKSFDDNNTEINDIESFTEQQVQYMNDSYYELFFIKDGVSIDGDNFQNGPILKYEYEPSENKWYALDDNPTKGAILQKGTAWFVSDTSANVIELIDIYKEMNERREIRIKGYNWTIDPNTPANGLPMLPIEVPGLLSRYPRESNILEHTVTVEWNCIGKSEDDMLSNVKSKFVSIA